MNRTPRPTAKPEPPPEPYTLLQIDYRISVHWANLTAAELAGDNERAQAIRAAIDRLLERRHETTTRSAQIDAQTHSRPTYGSSEENAV